ncbi:DDE superfamily endonuclease [Popillia japonica]|uniref:DDE superfamily endonuclease n=1 Tax=Popillia japonica TaxID=7064 RepID=A0AAW1KGT4_POPJA
MCGVADGTLLPPYVTYISEHVYDTWKEGEIHGGPCCGTPCCSQGCRFNHTSHGWKEGEIHGGPCCGTPCCSQGCRFNHTSHGWMDAITFEDWFVTTLLPHVRRLEGKKVIVGDNLASHFNDNVLALCEQSNIAFVYLVVQSTHLCQPLDVAFFKPFKVALSNVLSAYNVRHHNASGIAKQAFQALLKDAIKRIDTLVANTNKERPVLRRKKQRLNVVPERSVGTHQSSSSEDEDVPLQDDFDDEAEIIRHTERRV